MIFVKINGIESEKLKTAIKYSLQNTFKTFILDE